MKAKKPGAIPPQGFDPHPRPADLLLARNPKWLSGGARAKKRLVLFGSFPGYR